MSIFGNRLAALRQEKGFSQEQIALKLGVTKQTISNYERGIRNPDNKTLVDLALLYNCSTDYLLGKTDTRVGDDLLDEVNTIPDNLLVAYGNAFDAKKALYAESTPAERELILIYRDLNNEGQSILIGTAHGLAANPNMKKDLESNTETTA